MLKLSLIETLLSCDVIRHGFSAYTTLLNDEGSVVDDAIVFRVRADDLSDVKAEWLLCLGAGQGLNLLIESAKIMTPRVSGRLSPLRTYPGSNGF